MIAQQVLNGLVLGGVYALFALGFTLIFGIHRIMNMAHGAVFMSGAFIGLFTVQAGVPIWAALPVAMIGAGLVSILIEVIAFKPLRKLALADAELASIISSIGAGLIVLSLGQYVSNTQTLRFPFGKDNFPVGPRTSSTSPLEFRRIIPARSCVSALGSKTGSSTFSIPSSVILHGSSLEMFDGIKVEQIEHQ